MNNILWNIKTKGGLTVKDRGGTGVILYSLNIPCNFKALVHNGEKAFGLSKQLIPY